MLCQYSLDNWLCTKQHLYPKLRGSDWKPRKFRQLKMNRWIIGTVQVSRSQAPDLGVSSIKWRQSQIKFSGY